MSRRIDLYHRAQRLVNEGYRNDDMALLLIRLRDKATVIESVVELGNFVAHSDRRTKGTIAHEARMFFKSVRLHLKFRNANNKSTMIDENDAIEIANYNFNRLSDGELIAATGRGKRAWHGPLNSAIEKIQLKKRDTSAEKLHEEERALMIFLLDTIVVQPKFNENRVWTDFCYALKKNRLIGEKQIDFLDKIKNGFFLFIVASMHGTLISLEKGWDAYLSACAKDGLICVDVFAEVPGDVKPLYFSYFPFQTSLPQQEFSAGNVFALPRNELWKKTIEVRNDIKLALVGG
jgi:hypothetical protein